MGVIDENHDLLKPTDWVKGDELLQRHRARLRLASFPKSALKVLDEALHGTDEVPKLSGRDSLGGVADER
jgi:hypothetical protein